MSLHFTLSNCTYYNKWNWYYNKFAKLLNWKFLLNIPRDRYWTFKPLMLEIIKNDQEKYYNTIKQLYFKWLTHNDISEIVKEIYWDNISSSAISNITSELVNEFELWQKRELEDNFVALYIDTMYCKVKRWDKYENEWYTIVLGLKYDGRREVLWVYSTPAESIYNWEDILQDLKNR